MIRKLLGDVPLSTFIDQHYLKLPFARPGNAQSLAHLGSWDTVDEILNQRDVDVLVVGGGRRWEGERVPTVAEAHELHAAGYTVLIRHAERHHAGLAELAAGFAADFCGPVDVHVYCTPASHHGFGWHYDAEDVFILQTQGVKEFSLRKNTVNPWPLVETLPRDMQYEREIMPLMRCTLEAGDWLYIPAGYWHMARADQPAVSLAVGVVSVAAMDVFDFLRPRLLESLLWRQRLPTPGAASTLNHAELAERYRALFADLADDLERMLRDSEFAPSFIADRTGRNQSPASQS